MGVEYEDIDVGLKGQRLLVCVSCIELVRVEKLAHLEAKVICTP